MYLVESDHLVCNTNGKNGKNVKNDQAWDSNCESQVSEATALPNVPQPLLTISTCRQI